jgi:hypothetical protein
MSAEDMREYRIFFPDQDHIPYSPFVSNSAANIPLFFELPPIYRQTDAFQNVAPSTRTLGLNMNNLQ